MLNNIHTIIKKFILFYFARNDRILRAERLLEELSLRHAMAYTVVERTKRGQYDPTIGSKGSRYFRLGCHGNCLIIVDKNPWIIISFSFRIKIRTNLVSSCVFYTEIQFVFSIRAAAVCTHWLPSYFILMKRFLLLAPSVAPAVVYVCGLTATTTDTFPSPS